MLLGPSGRRHFALRTRSQRGPLPELLYYVIDDCFKERFLFLFLQADIYEGCGKSKGCFGTAGDCVSTRNCTTMVTYKSLMNGAYEFEIFGRDVPSDSYIAVGFSTDRSMVCVLLSFKSYIVNDVIRVTYREVTA